MSATSETRAERHPAAVAEQSLETQIDILRAEIAGMRQWMIDTLAGLQSRVGKLEGK
jgi:hypothetical protein